MCPRDFPPLAQLSQVWFLIPSVSCSGGAGGGAVWLLPRGPFVSERGTLRVMEEGVFPSVGI